MSNDRRRVIEGIVFLIAYGLTIPLANWMIGHVGTLCPPNSPCLIPVAPGLHGGMSDEARDTVRRFLAGRLLGAPLP